jgi:hypothetical protein
MRLQQKQAFSMIVDRLEKTSRIYQDTVDKGRRRLPRGSLKSIFFSEINKVGEEKNLVGLQSFFIRILDHARETNDGATVTLTCGYLFALDIVRLSPDCLRQKLGSEDVYGQIHNASPVCILQWAVHLTMLTPQSPIALHRLCSALPEATTPQLKLTLLAVTLYEMSDFLQFKLCMEKLHEYQENCREETKQGMECLVEGHFFREEKDPNFKDALENYKIARKSNFITESHYKILQVACLIGLKRTTLASCILERIFGLFSDNDPSSFCCEVPHSGLLSLLHAMVHLEMTAKLVDVVCRLVRHGRDCTDGLGIIRQAWDQPTDDGRWRAFLEDLVRHHPCHAPFVFFCATEQEAQGDAEAAEHTLEQGCKKCPKNLLLHRGRAFLALERDPGCSRATRSILYEAIQLDQLGSRDLRHIYDSVWTDQRDSIRRGPPTAVSLPPPPPPRVQYWDQGEWQQGVVRGVSWNGQTVVEPTGLSQDDLQVWTSELRYLSAAPLHPGGLLDSTPLDWRKKLSPGIEEYITIRLNAHSSRVAPSEVLEYLHIESKGGILLVGGLLRDAIGHEYKRKKLPKYYFDNRGDVDIVTSLHPETVEFFCKNFRRKGKKNKPLSAAFPTTRTQHYYGATSCENMDFLMVRRSGMFLPKQKVRGCYAPVLPLVFGNCGYDLLTDAQARPFCCDTIYYDISSGTAIDPTGYGVLDASTLELRVTSDLYLLKNPEYIWRYLVRRACGYWGSEETKEKMRRSALHFWGEAHRLEHPTQLCWYYKKYTKTSNSGRSISGQQFVRILKEDGMEDLAARVMQPLCGAF